MRAISSMRFKLDRPPIYRPYYFLLYARDRREIRHVTIRSARSPTIILAGHQRGEDKIPDGATRKDRPLETESAIP